MHRALALRDQCERALALPLDNRLVADLVQEFIDRKSGCSNWGAIKLRS